jgi:hypothetical protein
MVEYYLLAGAPDATYRLITTYPAQLQATTCLCIAQNNCKLRIANSNTTARSASPPVIPAGQWVFACKYTFCSPWSPGFHARHFPLPTPRTTPTHAQFQKKKPGIEFRDVGGGWCGVGNGHGK